MKEVEYVAVPGASLWTARQGAGPPMVLCHGGPGMWDYLGPVAGMVDDMATAYRYDQRACGRSSGGPPFDVATAVADLEALREFWGVGEWVVAGHSWGAKLALAYCLEHPRRCRALAYISGTGVDPAWHAEYHRHQEARLSGEERRQLAEIKERLPTARGEEFAALDRLNCELSWSADFADRGRARELARSLLVEGFRVNYEVNRALGEDADRFAEGGELRERLATLRTPALVVHGEDDPRPAWAARQLMEYLPNATLKLLPGVGHFPWMERPELFRETLRSFLGGI